MRARTNVNEISRHLIADLDTLRPHVICQAELLDAWAGIETFAAVALRVMAKTNPSKVRDEARTVEMQVLLESK